MSRSIDISLEAKEVQEFFRSLSEAEVWVEEKGRLLWILYSATTPGLEANKVRLEDLAGAWSKMPVEIAREIAEGD